MPKTFRSLFAILILSLFLSKSSYAQPNKGKSISVAIGYGLTLPYDEVDTYGSGFYAQGEYIIGLKSWFGIRPYAGFILTSTNDDENQNNLFNLSESRAEGTAFLFGGKARIAAPIPWVAPFIEIGIGASIGSFETVTPATFIKKDGVSLHIPFALGLALGPKNNFEFAFTYYFHPEVKQFAGAAALGFSFPIK